MKKVFDILFVVSLVSGLFFLNKWKNTTYKIKFNILKSDQNTFRMQIFWHYGNDGFTKENSQLLSESAEFGEFDLPEGVQAVRLDFPHLSGIYDINSIQIVDDTSRLVFDWSIENPGFNGWEINSQVRTVSRNLGKWKIQVGPDDPFMSASNIDSIIKNDIEILKNQMMFSLALVLLFGFLSLMVSKKTTKETKFGIITIFLILLILEGTSAALSKLFSKSDSAQERKELLVNLGSKNLNKDRDQVIHPYFGYIENRDRRNQEVNDINGSHAYLSINRFGFVSQVELKRKRNSNEKLVGIFGGSVAQQFSFEGRDSFIKQLNRIKGWENNKIEVIGLAIGGFKQPQQLMVLNYMLSLGIKFDLLINIDGFNEVALPFAENFPAGVHPSFPRNWQNQIGQYRSRDTLKLFAKKAWIETGRLMWAEFFEMPFIRSSHFLSLIWKAGDSIFRNWANATGIEQITKKTETIFELHGPPYPIASENDALNISIDIWYQSNFQMFRITRANKIPYFHFLQPNQYDPRNKTKPFTDEERQKFINPIQPYAKGVQKGYPLLLKLSGEFKKEKMHFYDLGYIFKDSPKTLYRDDCCHFNYEGYFIMGDAIGDFVVRGWKKVE